MSTPAPSDPQPVQAASSEAAAAPGMESDLQQFWNKNSRAIYLFCAIVFLVIVGREAVSAFNSYRQGQVAKEYAAATTNDKLKAFAASHSSHELGGVAYLRLADDAYSAANYTEAASMYAKAANVLKTGPFAGRAQLGGAVSKVQGGSAAEGEARLREIANDVGQLKAVRAEAYYQLASIALSAGKNDEATKLLDQLNTVEPAGLWAQRALALRVKTGAAPASAADAAAPVIKLPGQP